MTGDALIAALELPTGSRVDKRVPKKLLIENGVPTTSDKKLIKESIEELIWLAALKPANIGVPEYRDDTREYLEVEVLRLTLRSRAKVSRLLELIHRTVPYPLLLLTEQDGMATTVSTANKRWAQHETGKTVLDGEVIAAKCDEEHVGEQWPAFSGALSLNRLPRTTLYDLYQGWIDTLLALNVSHLTGVFRLASNSEHAAVRYEALHEYARLKNEIACLRAAVAKEKQIAQRVELNLEMKRMQNELASIRYVLIEGYDDL